MSRRAPATTMSVSLHTVGSTTHRRVVGLHTVLVSGSRRHLQQQQARPAIRRTAAIMLCALRVLVSGRSRVLLVTTTCFSTFRLHI